MTDKNDLNKDHERIAAFADGELEGEAHLEMLEKSQCCQVTAAKIKHQQQLRRACERVMAKETACPCAIKEMVQKLCECEGADGEKVPSALARIGRWAPALVAAVLLLATVMLYKDASNPSTTPLDASVIPVARAEMFSSRHDTCSRSIETLNNFKKYAHDLTELPHAVSTKLGTPVPALDLTSLGYRFAGAGDCYIPGTDSVHLVYKATPDSGHADSVSLWMCADDDKLPIAEGRVYTRQCPDTGRKLLVWRHHGVTYYLIGDEPERTRRIAESLQLTT